MNQCHCFHSFFFQYNRKLLLLTILSFSIFFCLFFPAPFFQAGVWSCQHFPFNTNIRPNWTKNCPYPKWSPFFFFSSRHLYLLKYIWDTDVSSFLNLFVHLIAHEQIQRHRKTPRNHLQVDPPPPQKIIYHQKRRNKLFCQRMSGTGFPAIYLFTLSELGKGYFSWNGGTPKFISAYQPKILNTTRGNHRVVRLKHINEKGIAIPNLSTVVYNFLSCPFFLL